jgi:cell division protein FtsW
MDDSIYRLRNHDILTLVVVALLGIGVIMVQSASQSVTGSFNFAMTDLGQKQLMFAGIGLFMFTVFRSINYRRLLPGRQSILLAPPIWLIVIAAVVCVLVLIPGVGFEKNGARRWLKLGPVQLQPSELAKWACVIFLAWWLTQRPIDLSKFRNFLLTLVPVGLLCLLVVIQDFGTAALIGVVAIAMLLAGRVKLWHLGVVLPPALGIACWFVMHKEYRWKRMTAFLDPYAAPQGDGYHMIQSLLSFATGGLSGTGLGGGIQKLGYLPEDTTDFVFATLSEETGFFGAATVIVLYVIILMIAWQVMKKPRDSFGQLLAFGIAAMVCTQAAINIAVATVSVPTKGLSLPLISSGGSGLVITCCALGLLANILRHHHSALSEEPARPAPASKAIDKLNHRARKQRTVDDRLWSQWTTK